MDNLSYFTGLIRDHGYSVIAIIVFLESMGVPCPGETVLILGGVAASLGHLNLLDVIIVTAIAAIAGDNVGFFIGHKFGKKLIKKYENFHFFREENITKIKNFFHKHGNKTIFLGRFVAVSRTYVAVLAGVFHANYWAFFFYNTSASIVWAIIFGLLGFYVGNNLPFIETVLTDFKEVIIVATILAITALLMHYLFKKRTSKVG